MAQLGEGLGSAYERYAVNRFLEDLASRRGVRTVAEWPANGVLGVPGLKSLALAQAGCDVTLLHPDAAFLEDVDTMWRAAGVDPPRHLIAEPDGEATPARAFDLVWSFCALEHVARPDAALEAMLRASRGVVVVFVQNAWAPGVHLHRVEHALTKKRWDHGAIGLMRAEAVARRLVRAGGRILEVGGVDLPPWPDLNVRLPRPWEPRVEAATRARRYGPGDPVRTAEVVARAFAGPASWTAEGRALAAWHDRIEARIPRGVLRWVAHHPYVMAEPDR